MFVFGERGKPEFSFAPGGFSPGEPTTNFAGNTLHIRYDNQKKRAFVSVR